MDKKSAPVRLGVVGTNFVSDWLVEAARQTSTIEVTAVCSRSRERADAFAGRHNIPLAYADWSAFLTDGACEAVYLASPNALHARQTLEALGAGRHVLCEKPMALNAAQAGAMIACAKEAGLVLLEAIRPAFDPFLALVRESLPRIGRVRRAAFEFCQYSSRYDRFLAGEHVNIFDASLGNAAILDLGVYCARCCVSLFGMPRRVEAGASFLPNGTEAAGVMLLDYGEMQATITYSKVTESTFPSVIQGELGTLAFDKLSQPSYVRLYGRDGRFEPLPFTPVKNNMIFELDAFARCVRGMESADEHNAQTAQVLTLLDAARAQTGVRFGENEALLRG